MTNRDEGTALDLPDRQTISVPEAGRICGLSRNGAYAAAARGELPTVRIGRKLRVPTHRLAQLLNGETVKRVAA